MNRRLWFGPPRPRTQPPDAVVPVMLGNGNLRCPACGGEVATPVEPNPFVSFVEPEKMILLGNRTCRCPHEGCGIVHWITPALAFAHNAYWYPDDYSDQERG